MKRWITIFLLLAGVFAMSHFIESCRKNNSSGNFNQTPLVQVIPAGFPQPHYKFENNPLTEEGFELGRKLFYDGRLSKDGNFSCASCHQQFAAFSTYDHNLSHGFNNAFTTRNAPALFNLAWQKEFMHDGGINNIEVQPLAPITAPNEMAETIDNVIGKLQADAKYREMFKAAFGDETINSQRMLKALAQFTCSIVSADSKYDRVKKGQGTFNPYEQRGYTLFQAKCASCHAEPLFTDLSYRNIGLAIDPYLKDFGRMKITNDRTDSLKFKVPSLRNVNITFPYMHDGRFASLGQCINHYRTGIIQSATLDPSLVNGIQFTNAEVVDLVEFLRSLTDSTFIKDTRFAQPN
jgi:cytochrome c peroxidase